ncbi:hypothetical protein BDW62DRAFT_216189 [Aspergillus aurantiobrunneus]
MSRLRTPGSFPQYDPHPIIYRLKTQPASRLFAKSRVNSRAGPGSTARSFLPSPPQDSVRPFNESRLGSRLPVRSPSPTQQPHSFCLPSLIEERRAARQARPRPWVSERSTLPSWLHLSSRNPMAVPKSTIPPSYEPETSVNGGRKSKPVKRVHFGETTVISTTAAAPVTRWIDQQEHVHRPPCGRKRMFLPTKIPAQAQSTAQVDQVGNFKAKPKTSVKGGRKSKPTKTVRFGETTVISVTRWIDRRKNTYPDPIPAGGRLLGWTVTPLSEPNDQGEMEERLLSHHANGPCGRQNCAWNALARIQAKRPSWDPSTVFKCWLLKRDSIRSYGVHML